MAQDEELSDEELIERVRAGEESALAAMYRRHDAALLNALARQLRGVKGREELARDIADRIWLRISSHPGYLLRHDPGRRPLDAFLAWMARREARRARQRLGRKRRKSTLPTVPLGKRDIVDPSAEQEALAEEWQELMATLSDADVAFLEKILSAKRKRTRAEQKRLERLIQNLQRYFGLC